MTVERLRLNKAIALAGLASRREADALLRRGVVRLNGRVAEPGESMLPGTDRLEVSGRAVTVPVAPVPELWALYKPKACVSTLHDPEGRPCLADHLPRSAGRLFPIGRLDYDAEGLILLTNDGDLAHRVAHPSFGVDKVYLVKVKGLVQPEALRRLGHGPQLEGRRRQSVRARVLHTHNDKTWLEVTLREGIQHHIKKMFSAEGHRVLKIKRFQVGPVGLDALTPGRTRKLGRTEIEALLAGRRSKPPQNPPSAAGEAPPVLASGPAVMTF
jgi:23S rRNA pseudouridine2605 synthase